MFIKSVFPLKVVVDLLKLCGNNMAMNKFTNILRCTALGFFSAVTAFLSVFSLQGIVLMLKLYGFKIFNPIGEGGQEAVNLLYNIRNTVSKGGTPLIIHFIFLIFVVAVAALFILLAMRNILVHHTPDQKYILVLLVIGIGIAAVAAVIIMLVFMYNLINLGVQLKLLFPAIIVSLCIGLVYGVVCGIFRRAYLLGIDNKNSAN